MGIALRRMRTVLPAQDRGRRYRRNRPDQRFLPVPQSRQLPLQGLCEPPEERFGLRSADRRGRADTQLVAGDLCLRLVEEGKPLFDWHPLLSGDPNSVHKAGISVFRKAVSEDEVDDIENHIQRWLNQGPPRRRAR